MKTAILTSLLLTTLSLPALAAEPIAIAPKFQPPVLTLMNSLGENPFAHSSNVAVMGTIKPPLETRIDVSAYHVLDDGGLLLLGRSSVKPLPNGQFSCDFHPASPGWKPGTLRIVAELSAMQQIRAIADLTILDPGEPLKPWITYERPSSSVVADLNAEKPNYVVPPNQKYLIRGVQDQAAQGQLIKVVRKHEGKSVSFSEAIPLWLRNAPRPWFETQMISPRKEGTYEIQLLDRAGNVIDRASLNVAVPVAKIDHSQRR